MQLGQKLSTNLPSVSSWSNLSEISEASNGDVDTRSADEIFILKKSILDSSQNDFIEAILSDKLGTEFISKYLRDSSLEIRNVALSFGCTSLSSEGLSESKRNDIFASFSRYFEQNSEDC